MRIELSMRSSLLILIAIAFTSRAASAQSPSAPRPPSSPAASSAAPAIAPPGAPFYPPLPAPPAPGTYPPGSRPPPAHAPYAYPPPPGVYFYPRELYVGSEEGREKPPATRERPGRTVIRRRNPGMFVGGVVLMVAGSLATVVGAALFISTVEEEPAEDAGPVDRTAEYVGSSSLLGIGAVSIAIGVPLAVIGGRAPAPPPRSGVFVGPGSVRWSTAF
jgi:hypothetical protein